MRHLPLQQGEADMVSASFSAFPSRGRLKAKVCLDEALKGYMKLLPLDKYISFFYSDGCCVLFEFVADAEREERRKLKTVAFIHSALY